MDNDKEFDKILQDALAKAKRVECSLQDYVYALAAWIEELEVEMDANKGLSDD